MMFNTIKAFCLSSVFTLMAHSAFGALVLTGDVVEISTPTSVVEGNGELANAQLFQEKGAHTLAVAVALDEPVSPATAGTFVDAFYLRFDAADTGNLETATGSITFVNPIIGLIYSEAGLDASDAELGILLPSQYNAGRKTEIPGDSLTIVGGGFTLEFNLRVEDNGVDDLRILTAGTVSHMPEPTSMAVWLSLSAIGCFFARRGRRFTVQ